MSLYDHRENIAIGTNQVVMARYACDHFSMVRYVVVPSSRHLPKADVRLVLQATIEVYDFMIQWLLMCQESIISSSNLDGPFDSHRFLSLNDILPCVKGNSLLE